MGGKKRKILVVDDEPTIIQSIHLLLEDKYELLAASSGKSAVECVKTVDIDIVILDYMLPGETGLDILRMIKSTKPSIPVILITAYGDEEVAINALRFGAKDYIKKPFNFQDMLNRIEFYVSLRNEKEQRHVCFDNPLREKVKSPRCRVCFRS
ncbi:MAG: response regulator [Nitrospirae bacterium]|nr:response regulator [Nitrospirota bacterium]